MIAKFWVRYKKISFNFHNFYTKATGIFSPLYIPDNLHYAYIDRYYNNWEKAKIIDNKTLYYMLFADLPQPKTIVYRAGKFWYTGDHVIITLEKAIKILSLSNDFFIKKAEDSYGGHGVKHIEIGSESLHDINQTINSCDTDILVQQGIKQSNTLAAINPSSVNTLRIMTLLRKDGSVKIVSHILRMGINGAKVDNASSGGITCGIKEDGHLKSVAYAVNGHKFSKHPNTAIKFDSIFIPNFDAAVKMVISKAKSLPHFRLISWDIAMDKNDEPIFIEANLRDGEIDFHQLNNGPLYGDETEDILKEVFAK